MKKINYNIDDFNIICNYTFSKRSCIIYIDILFGNDWNIFDLLQFAMFDNDF
jgi:hypothetical protein